MKYSILKCPTSTDVRIAATTEICYVSIVFVLLPSDFDRWAVISYLLGMT